MLVFSRAARSRCYRRVFGCCCFQALRKLRPPPAPKLAPQRHPHRRSHRRSYQRSPYFTDHAAAAGLTSKTVFGGVDTKKYIIETTGTGVAIFDYDNDGWPDIFLVNGSTLEGFPAGKAPTSHLYHNNHDGTFTDVSEKAGVARAGWGQGVCVGDYDNDGNEDLYVTYYGKNVLYHNNGNGTFSGVGEKAGVAGNGKSWGSGCALWTTIATATWM